MQTGCRRWLAFRPLSDSVAASVPRRSVPASDNYPRPGRPLRCAQTGDRKNRAGYPPR
jgi:hypothetical protein